MPAVTAMGRSRVVRGLLPPVALAVALLGSEVPAHARAVREVFEQVTPSVVVIRAEGREVRAGGEATVAETGSGVLISGDGQVMTAAHVVHAMDTIAVEFPDGESVPARVVASEPAADLSLLQLERVPPAAAVARMADSDTVQVGDQVLVVGAPYGLTRSLSVGYISARWPPNTVYRTMPLAEFFQTDAVINTGNSGGPMFNMEGEVVGIVSHNISRGGGSEGLGFVVTLNTARQLLLEKKSFWSGLEGLLLSDRVADLLNLPGRASGFIVKTVARGSPGDQIGLRGGTVLVNIAGEEVPLGGDIIMAVNGIPVSAAKMGRIRDDLGRLAPGTPFAVTVLRAGEVLALTGRIPAATGATSPPDAGEAALPAPADTDLPPPTRETLPNGVRLIIQEHRAADIVAVHMWIGAGVRHETTTILGAAHFQEHMLFKGAGTWGPGDFDRAIEGEGGRSNAVTSNDYTNFYVLVPSEGLERGVELLADMAFRARFDPQEIRREAEVIAEEARIEQDNPRTAIVRRLYALVFQGHPYGRPVLGTPETRQAATRDTLVAFNRRHYTPENISVIVVGPVDPAAVRAVVDRTFGRQPATGSRPEPVPRPAPLPGVVKEQVERPEQQGHIALGWQAPPSDDPAGYAVDLLTSILAGTESSRLARRLRDEERLVTAVSMSYVALMGGGIVSLRAEGEARDLDRVEQVVLEEIARIRREGPTEEERELAVTKYESEHALATETSEGLAANYGVAQTTWTLEAELTYVQSLRGITREQIRDAARRYLPPTAYVRLDFVPRAR
jgi:predicted Zn-dependent peptidase/S1-C subfamily serine protease